MRYKIVAIRDRATDTFSQPQYVAAIGGAVRSFSDLVNNKETDVGKHPDDFDLYELGEFDDDSGEFHGVKPRQIAIGKDQVR